MTPSQKLIDAAAEAVWEADRALVLPKSRDQMPPWPDAPEDIRESYRARVTIPVTVALRAAVEVAEGFEFGPPDEAFCKKRPDEGELIRALYDRTTDTAAAIASLIPQEPLGSEFEAVWDANTDKLHEP
jgi:hypothetical protein